MRSIPNKKYEKLDVDVMVHVLQTTKNLVISRCCFAEDGKEMYIPLYTNRVRGPYWKLRTEFFPLGFMA